MALLRDEAPERPRGRSGALFVSLLVPLLLMGLTAGCDVMGGGATIALDSTEISIPGEVHEVEIAGAGAADSIAPARIQAQPGDAIRFLVTDRRPHAPSFRVDSLEPVVREYLESTGQLRGPPLVNEGSSWVVLLGDDAPAGRYPFYCRSHDAEGEIIVGTED